MFVCLSLVGGLIFVTSIARVAIGLQAHSCFLCFSVVALKQEALRTLPGGDSNILRQSMISSTNYPCFVECSSCNCFCRHIFFIKVSPRDPDFASKYSLIHYLRLQLDV